MYKSYSPMDGLFFCSKIVFLFLGGEAKELFMVYVHSRRLFFEVVCDGPKEDKHARTVSMSSYRN